MISVARFIELLLWDSENHALAAARQSVSLADVHMTRPCSVQVMP